MEALLPGLDRRLAETAQELVEEAERIHRQWTSVDEQGRLGPEEREQFNQQRPRSPNVR